MAGRWFASDSHAEFLFPSGLMYSYPTFQFSDFQQLQAQSLPIHWFNKSFLRLTGDPLGFTRIFAFTGPGDLSFTQT
jgi:hypothetical protein